MNTHPYGVFTLGLILEFTPRTDSGAPLAEGLIITDLLSHERIPYKHAGLEIGGFITLGSSMCHSSFLIIFLWYQPSSGKDQCFHMYGMSLYILIFEDI